MQKPPLQFLHLSIFFAGTDVLDHRPIHNWNPQKKSLKLWSLYRKNPSLSCAMFKKRECVKHVSKELLNSDWWRTGREIQYSKPQLSSITRIQLNYIDLHKTCLTSSEMSVKCYKDFFQGSYIIYFIYLSMKIISNLQRFNFQNLLT